MSIISEDNLRQKVNLLFSKSNLTSKFGIDFQQTQSERIINVIYRADDEDQIDFAIAEIIAMYLYPYKWMQYTLMFSSFGLCIIDAYYKLPFLHSFIIHLIMFESILHVIRHRLLWQDSYAVKLIGNNKGAIKTLNAIIKCRNNMSLFTHIWYQMSVSFQTRIKYVKKINF